MFKSKTKKNGRGALKSSMIYGSELFSRKMGKSLKHAGYQMEYMGDYIKKNPGLSIIAKSVQKSPTGGVLAIFGVGLMIYGIMSLIRK